MRFTLEIDLDELAGEPAGEVGHILRYWGSNMGTELLQPGVAHELYDSTYGEPVGSFTIHEEDAMGVELNHTIVAAHDRGESAAFAAEILGLPAPTPFGPFLVVEVGNNVSLDFMETDGDIASQHYAFLVGESEFDEIFGRIRARELPYWADPGRRRRGEINHNDGGRGVYFPDPAGHLLEIITRPYGSGG